MTLFANTFALIAWLNPRDNDHARVTAYLDEFSGRLVTTEWVLMELADALSAPLASCYKVGRFSSGLCQLPLAATPKYSKNSNR
jgi:hypothetical protein